MSAYPASRFHITARTSRHKRSVRICRLAGSNIQGEANSMTARSARMPRPIETSGIFSSRATSTPRLFRKQALRADQENDEKHQMAGQQLPAGVEMRSDALRNPNDDATRQRAPKAAEPSENDGFEGNQQAAGTRGRVEIRP